MPPVQKPVRLPCCAAHAAQFEARLPPPFPLWHACTQGTPLGRVVGGRQCDKTRPLPRQRAVCRARTRAASPAPGPRAAVATSFSSHNTNMKSGWRHRGACTRPQRARSPSGAVLASHRPPSVLKCIGDRCRGSWPPTPGECQGARLGHPPPAKALVALFTHTLPAHLASSRIP